MEQFRFPDAPPLPSEVFRSQIRPLPEAAFLRVPEHLRFGVFLELGVCRSPLLKNTRRPTRGLHLPHAHAYDRHFVRVWKRETMYFFFTR